MKKILNSASFAITISLTMGACASSESDLDNTNDWVNESAAATPQHESDIVQDAQTANSLRDQQISMLVREHVTRARQAYADARLLEAENELLAALQLNAGANDATALLEQVQVALGRANTDITNSSDDVLLRAKARGERLQADALANLEAAKQLRSEGDYDGALGKLNLAGSIVNGSDLNINWGSLDSEIEGLLVEVSQQRDSSLAEQRAQAARDSFNALQQERELEMERQNLRRDGILEDAIKNFDNGDYDDTIELCKGLIQEDPHNLRAKELLTS
ncbi:MAG: hypothetical protein QGF46_08900, partial [Planctomycetota bacterium]|nr:hypothetical protein [Planctomycetota bacterium]